MTSYDENPWVSLGICFGIPIALGVFIVLLFGCAPLADPGPFDASDTERPTVDATHDVSSPAPDARAPVHDVTPVCADDAAGCNPEPQHACPPWCPAGGPIGHRQQ